VPAKLQPYADALEHAWQRVGQVTAALYASGDMNKTLANASVYLEAVGHTVVAWIWLEQALLAARQIGAAPESDQDFYRGKLQACRYFFNWELPKVGPQLDLLASIDTTTLDMQDAWF
jgi:butyryl-CoA dehydrogenase